MTFVDFDEPCAEPVYALLAKQRRQAVTGSTGVVKCSACRSTVLQVGSPATRDVYILPTACCAVLETASKGEASGKSKR